MLNDIFNKVRDSLNEAFSDKDVSVKCPNCGAQGQSKQSQKTFVCQYCGCENNNPEYRNLFDLQQLRTNTNNTQTNFNDDFDNTSSSVVFGSGLYAYIEKSALFYNGEIPGITFGKANLCTSYEECVTKLREIANNERSKAFFEAPNQNLEEIRKAHPKAKIIEL